MVILTDSVDYAALFLPASAKWRKASMHSRGPSIQGISGELLGSAKLSEAVLESENFWGFCFISEYSHRSQYDSLIDLARRNVPLPDRMICLSGSGENFHGFKGRPWVALPGNIHMVAYLAPDQPIKYSAAGFMVLAAVSVVQAIDDISDLRGRAALKWINDILIEGAKICGVIVHTQQEGNIVAGAILGIGLNVEATPVVSATPYVPKVASLSDFCERRDQCNRREIVRKLMTRLKENYLMLIGGAYLDLLDYYQERSIVLGREVAIYSDSLSEIDVEIARGKTVRIGPNLELYIEGREMPVTGGRLVLQG